MESKEGKEKGKENKAKQKNRAEEINREIYCTNQ
jgi:hypothetical protein